MLLTYKITTMKNFFYNFIKSFLDEKQIKTIYILLKYSFYIFIIIHYTIGILSVFNEALFNSIHEIIISYIVIITEKIIPIYNKFFNNESYTYIPNLVSSSYKIIKSQYETTKYGLWSTIFSLTPLDYFLLEILGGELSMIFITLFINIVFKK
uniref:hypothetical protein n=1 Tax=Ganoderma sichuanense TaxID=1173713 RepID=UPI001BF1589B|nr:hypothetical protein MFP96_mgp32 [Ganoderma sichuanense]QUA00740.1 hypothetical protein [Ganoderma sichuanense]